MLYEIVGRKVAEQRREAEFSQAELAHRCGFARGSIANIESGRQRPTLHTLWAIATVLSVDVRTFLPSPKEYLVSEAVIANSQITGRLKKVAGESQNQVAAFIYISREEVSSDDDGEAG